MGKRRVLLAALLTLGAAVLFAAPGATGAEAPKRFDFTLDLTNVPRDAYFVIAADEAGNHRVAIMAGPVDGFGDGCFTISFQPLATCQGPLGLRHGGIVPHRAIGATGPVLVLFVPGGVHTVVTWSNGVQSRIDCSWNPVGFGLSQVVVNGTCTPVTPQNSGYTGTLVGTQDVCWTCAQPQQDAVIFHWFGSAPL